MGASFSTGFQTVGLVLFIVADSLQTYFPWYIRKSTSDCSTIFEYKLSEVSYGFSSASYPNCHNYEGNRTSHCNRIYALGFLMMISTFLNISICGFFLCSLVFRGLMSSQLKLRHNRAILIGLMMLAASTMTELIGFSILFPYQRPKYCKYCTMNDNEIINQACDYGFSHYLSWIQLIFIIIVGWGFNFTSRYDDVRPYMVDWQNYMPRGWRKVSSASDKKSLLVRKSGDDNDDDDDTSRKRKSTSMDIDTVINTDDYVVVGQQPSTFKVCGIAVSSRFKVCFSVGFCTLLSFLAIIFTFFLINVFIPRDPTPVDYCTYFFDEQFDEAHCPVDDDDFFYDKVESIFDNNVTINDDLERNQYHLRCPSMLCEETCCSRNALQHLPDFKSLFNQTLNATSIACLDSLNQVECLPCSPLSHKFNLGQYNLTHVKEMSLELNSTFIWPVAMCDSFCNTVYKNCRSSQLSSFGLARLEGLNCSDDCPTLKEVEGDYDNRICQKMFQTEEIRHFAFTDECFDGERNRIRDFRLPFVICLLGFAIWS